ncbi:Scd6-like Sm domain-containing protein [Amylocarpus encephaloides]|uniref:Scd6-like Sm domain-containing protein n=1 Tax=Amylocarpus encephaloides TaxID=45428 RepID=A0A9P7YGS1_9HELO|nr:Scd6-like Sm domain-containing protein [Amylocarpus encephaloides]
MSEFLGHVPRNPHFVEYIGTLHEINSEASTVALENVSSFGTEGRKNNPEEEIPPSDNVYEYIVFRGSDVKDLRIERAAAPTEPPKVPDDPAILGLKLRLVLLVKINPRIKISLHHKEPHSMDLQARVFLLSLNSTNFPRHSIHLHQQDGDVLALPDILACRHSVDHLPASGALNDKQEEPKSSAKPAEMAATSVKAPTPPVESKPSPSAVQAAVSQASTGQSTTTPSKLTPSGPKNNNRIQPAIPLKSPARAAVPLANISNVPASTETTLKDATAAATAAVAAAMAKLPPTTAQANGNGVDNLAKKVNEMRVSEPTRGPRQPTSTGGFNARAPRSGRGGARGGSAPKVEVPATDFDFAESNAKFNKQDLVKEAIAGSPPAENSQEDTPEPEVPAGGYNKASSFFDNISSESKDRAEAGNSRPGGKEWRGEEQKRNVETFGQGSVDNNYRGGYRGRGRGRGYRGRGYNNGQPARGRGGYRGRGDAQAIVQ